jgi:large subunit ribosomal protein L6
VKLFVKFGKHMSRIGRKPIILPAGVTATIEADKVQFVSGKGNLTVPVIAPIVVKQEADQLLVTNPESTPASKALHGLIRSLLNNAIVGLTAGYQKDLQLIGTGYRVAAHPEGLSLNLGFSHPVIFKRVPGAEIVVEGNDKIKISGIDKQLVGQVAANIRALKPPEPYKGKGVRYVDEVVIRKAGKAAVKSAS